MEQRGEGPVPLQVAEAWVYCARVPKEDLRSPRFDVKELAFSFDTYGVELKHQATHFMAFQSVADRMIKIK